MITAGDCRDMPWEGDVLITDPPYRAHVHKSAYSQSQKRGATKRELGFTHLSPSLRRWTCALAARMPRWSVIFTDVESAAWWRLSLQAAGAQYIRTIPWVRWSMPQLSGDRPPSGCELIVLAHGKAKKAWDGPGNLTHVAHTCMRGASKHKTQKPLGLMLDLVNWFSSRGEQVIDPFSGSGTTGLACTLLGRQFSGAELDPGWAAVGETRRKATDSLAMSMRDAAAYRDWAAADAIAREAQVKRTAHTANVRAKLEANANAGQTVR